MKSFYIIDKNGINLKTANTHVSDDINVGLTPNDKQALIPENIKKDVSILGVTGTYEKPDGYIRPSGKIEITNTEEINVTNYETAQVVDSNLSAENIKEGVSILGKVGTFKGGSGEDRLKKLLDTTKSAIYLFCKYTGTSVDDLIQYSDTENVTNMGSMFQNCSNLQTVPQLDTSKVTSMSYMFYYCSKLQTIPQLDTSNVTSMSEMFYLCLNLQTIPQLDTSKVANMSRMFSNCTNLQNIPQLNTSNVTSMNEMFPSCRSLQSIPQLDTSKVTNMSYMFENCSNLTTIPQLNMINVTSTGSMFRSCTKLTNLTLLNIKVNLQIGSGTSYGHLLTLDSLINTIKELVNVGASRTLTMGSANLEKIANVYVRRTTTGDIPTCLSDNSNIDLAKAPCEVCEPTDEGAMLITAYANSKNWSLA